MVSSDIKIQRINDNTDSKEIQIVYLSVDGDAPTLLPTLSFSWIASSTDGGKSKRKITYTFGLSIPALATPDVAIALSIL